MSVLEGIETETWDDAALLHTLRIWNHRLSGLSTTPVEEIRLMVDFMIDHHFHGDNVIEDDSCWLDLGALALKAHPFASAVDVSRILSKKQKDYGPNNIARFALALPLDSEGCEPWLIWVWGHTREQNRPFG